MKAEFKKWWTAEGKELFSLLVNDVSYSDAYLVWKEAVQAERERAVGIVRNWPDRFGEPKTMAIDEVLEKIEAEIRREP